MKNEHLYALMLILVVWIMLVICIGTAQAQDVSDCTTYGEATKELLAGGNTRMEDGQPVLETPYEAVGSFIDNFGHKYHNTLINRDSGRWIMFESDMQTSCVTKVENGDMFILRHPTPPGSTDAPSGEYY